MSLGEADAKFPNQSSDASAPPPSRENPGQVYPKSDPQAAPAESVPGTGGDREPSSIMGNPFALRSTFAKIEQALNEAISTIEGEQESEGSSFKEQTMVQKFKAWRLELDFMRAGNVHDSSGGTPQEGGLFTD